MTTCKVCDSVETQQVMDLGRVALAGGFLAKEQLHADRTYPLHLLFCRDCLALQVAESVPPAELFGRYFYRSSTSRTLREHFAAYAADLAARFAPRKVVEIGCNDGAMLRPLAALGIEAIGVDPSEAALEAADGTATVLKGYFGPEIAEAIGHSDVVVANNVFAHVDDINGFTAAVRVLLGDAGVFVFEVHYLGDMVRDGQYDAIYHEHRFYWSLLSVEQLLARHGLQVFDVQPQRTHGGSMRFYVAPTGTRRVLPQVTRLRMAEQFQLLDWAGTYERFAAEAIEHRHQMRGLIGRLRKNGHTIAAYGASGRANTMLQWCGMGPGDIEYIVDDCPGKQGLYTPGSHIPIRHPSTLTEREPDWLLVTAWTFLDEIADRARGYRGGLLVPFPRVMAHPPREVAAA